MSRIYTAPFTDKNGDIYFFINGKRSVLGINYPDTCISNEDNYTFIQIGYFEIVRVDPTDIVTIDEEFMLLLENPSNVNYVNNKVAKVHIMGLVKGGSVLNDTFTVECESSFKDMKIPDIYLCINNIDNKEVISIWVKTENTNKISVCIGLTNAINLSPIDIYHFDSGYRFYLTENDDIVVDVNTSNMEDYIKSISICSGKDRFGDMIDRLTELENRPSLKIHSVMVSYDSGFEPIPNGDEASQYQIINPVFAKYSIVDVPFIAIDSENKHVKILSSGTYQISIISGILAQTDESEVNKVEIVPTINSDNINELSLQYDPKIKLNQIVSGNYVVQLEADTVLRLKFKFLDGIDSNIRENGFTKMMITKFI